MNPSQIGVNPSRIRESRECAGRRRLQRPLCGPGMFGTLAPRPLQATATWLETLQLGWHASFAHREREGKRARLSPLMQRQIGKERPPADVLPTNEKQTRSY